MKLVFYDPLSESFDILSAKSISFDPDYYIMECDCSVAYYPRARFVFMGIS